MEIRVWCLQKVCLATDGHVVSKDNITLIQCPTITRDHKNL